MGSRFNVPNLFFISLHDKDRHPSKRGIHIARTNIAGCTTECGIRLEAGQVFSRREPQGICCRQCEEAIHHLAYPGRGLALDEKHQEWLHLKEFAP